MDKPQRRLWWSDYASREFEGLDPLTTIAILPIAAIEQHGPHLPVGVDTQINRGMLATLIERLPDDLDIRILPVQEVGKSNEHLRMPGTLTLPATALITVWTELGLSVARAGVKKLVFVNSHGGNDEVMGIVARELRVQADMLVVKSAWSRLGRPAGVYSEREQKFGIHGGDAETSLMLHFRPDLVDMSRAQDFRSVAEEDEAAFSHLRPTGFTSYAWLAGDLNAEGAVGEAHKATADKGRRTAEHSALEFIKLLYDVKQAKLPG
jgi:creatinine amidohydrolase